MKNSKKPSQENIGSSVNGSDYGAKRAEHSLRKKRGLSRAAKGITAISLILLVFICGSGIMKGIIARFLVNAIPARTSVLEETKAADIIVIREEEVVPAPVSGRLEIACREGERIAKGTIVGYLVTLEGTSLEKEKKVPLVSPRAGILSFQLDGYESVFKLENWTLLDIRKLEQEQGLAVQDNGDARESEESGERMVEAGQNLFRITDNLQPNYLYLEIEAPLPEAVRNGEIEIRLNGPDGQLVRGSVADIYRDRDKYRTLVQVPGLPEIQNTRRAKGYYIVNKYQGVVLNRQVLVMKGDNTGLYILDKGQVAWQQVEVAGTVGERVAVTGLKQNDWIITAPSLVKEGQKIIFYK